MTILANLVDAVADTALNAAAALTPGSDVIVVNQGGTDVRTTPLAIATVEVPSIPVSGALTLSAAAHHRRTLYCSTSLTLTVPSAATLGDGFTCDVVTLGTSVVTLSGSVTKYDGTAITTLTAGGSTTIKASSSAVYGVLPVISAPAATPALTILTIGGQAPGGTSTASLSFANGAPASLTATLDGSALTIANITITTNAGSGATASGTASFTFTTPASGSHSIVASGTGTYATSSNTYTLVTSSSPLLAISSVTPVGVGVTATATGTFANGLPASITATMDGGALTIANVVITTTSGTGATAAGTFSFAFTNPAAGSHTLVATGTGTYAGTSNSYGYSTATPTITVNTITAPAPSASIPVSGTYTNFTPAGLDYSTDGGSTWTGATSPVITGGTYSFSIAGGVPASGTAYTVKVRGTIYTSIIGTSNSFTVTAAGGTITAPGSSSVNVAAAFAVTVTGSGNPTVYASITSGGTEQLPRTAVPYGSTSVNLTPTAQAASTASLYAASTGGAALATSGSFTPAAAPVTKLLDTITATVQGAYGVRKLRAAYAGYAVRVKRVSDGALCDVGFDASGNLDMSSAVTGSASPYVGGLATFCAGASNDGRVVTWYDQSGNGLDLTTAVISGANLPYIYYHNVLQPLGSNNRATLQFNSSTDTRALGNLAFNLAGSGAALGVATVDSTAVAAARLVSYSSGATVADNTGTAAASFIEHATSNLAGEFNGSATSVVTAPAANAAYQFASVFNGTNHIITRDGIAGTTVTAATAFSGSGTGRLFIGCAVSTSNTIDHPYGGTCSEVLIVSGALSGTDQAAIASSQKTYYGTP